MAAEALGAPELRLQAVLSRVQPKAAVMDMQIDAGRIRIERERRAWTQAQLAGASGLGLRTVQRIEREGSASYESVQAIAAALELSITELRLEACATGTRSIGPVRSYLLRLMCAVLSGLAIPFYFVNIDDHGLISLIMSAPLGSRLIDYLVPGCLFAAAVLCPELRPGPTWVRRALVLVAASALSFFAAVWIAVAGNGWFGIRGGFVSILSAPLASVAGTGIVLLAAWPLVPIEFPVRLVVAGVVAAVLGGIAIALGFDIFSQKMAVGYASFAAWHLLLWLAIRVGRGSEWPLRSLRPMFRSARQLLPGGNLWRTGAPLHLN